ncbi:hydrogenase subunit MbhD domain-containing protein [Tateyamaria sp. syn59]|uniref:hydrogenase subunit MbhD domain-containing protein n=1 Tax=Tateyamaria sp. syn59 TaxID=2576942 RepID=UPI0011BEBB4E|nr:hydrogenase subunit MbhD domain-containing protein [Tateyamaria sp. syn59]
MTDPWIAFDLTLAGGMLVVAWLALASRAAFQMIVMFMMFGILASLSWVRLNAPDVALAEAAVGAGITGALLLRTLSSLRHAPKERAPHWPIAMVAGVLSLIIVGALGAALLMAPEASLGYDRAVAIRLDQSGVTNPVTAVLLNFRSYDTLLEIAVLSAALAIMLMLGSKPLSPRPLGPLFLPFAKVIVPSSVIIAGYLLWLGASQPGGAFQAAAVLAAGGIVLILGQHYDPRARDGALIRLVCGIGLAGFVLVAIGGQILTSEMLRYPEGLEKTWIVMIEATLTVSVAATLAALFVGALRKGTTA